MSGRVPVAPDYPSAVTVKEPRVGRRGEPAAMGGPGQNKKLDGLRRACVQFEALL